jgi:hypothetical protein
MNKNWAAKVRKKTGNIEFYGLLKNLGFTSVTP